MFSWRFRTFGFIAVLDSDGYEYSRMHVAILPFTLIPLPTCEAVSLSQWLLEVIGLSRRLPEGNGIHVAFGEAKQENTRF